jgi:hypothetical protein
MNNAFPFTALPLTLPTFTVFCTPAVHTITAHHTSLKCSQTLLEEINNLQRHLNITTSSNMQHPPTENKNTSQYPNDIILQAIIDKCVESNVFTLHLQNDDSDTFATYLEAYKCLLFLVEEANKLRNRIITWPRLLNALINYTWNHFTSHQGTGTFG